MALGHDVPLTKRSESLSQKIPKRFIGRPRLELGLGVRVGMGLRFHALLDAYVYVATLLRTGEYDGTKESHSE